MVASAGSDACHGGTARRGCPMLWVAAKNQSRNLYEHLRGKEFARKTEVAAGADSKEAGSEWKGMSAICHQGVGRDRLLVKRWGLFPDMLAQHDVGEAAIAL
ncbi:hypothetical protein IF1G_00035 [Cordyceps javanica]|uniref:Uncharacterized protein n=1 Tax=Cordyceps javanica TaxID=43265 RepID=A0A545VEF2_9HYPO|nr:hypothetical protein IF1G_00035 [Cordyceps javanica]